jgi:subtilisin-like proprotein convertase family protein
MAGGTAVLALSGILAGQALASAPAAPANSTGQTVSFTDDPAGDLTIQDAPLGGVGTVLTRTINVTGAQGHLRDVDLFTNIPHQSSGDLRITLEHAGRTVTLIDVVNDTGRWYPNWFTPGTLWDDSSANLITDVGVGDSNGDAKTDLVGEGKLGAFIGTNPNGAWTLRVQDRRNGDVGFLGSWRLNLATLPAAPPETTVTKAGPSGTDIEDGAVGPDAVPATGDDVPTLTTSSLTLSGARAYLTDVDVKTGITHEDSVDLVLTLVAPDGTRVPLLSPAGQGLPLSPQMQNVFRDTTWNDSAGALVSRVAWTTGVNNPDLVPEGALSALIGKNPNGVWKLEVVDRFGNGTGTLDSWSVTTKSTDGFAVTPNPTPNPNPQPQPQPQPQPVQISSETACLPASAVAFAKGSARLTPKGLAATQSALRTGVNRANGIEGWLRAGITAGDLCGGAIGQADLSVPSAAGTTLQAIAAPAPRRVAVTTVKVKAAKRLNAGQVSRALRDATTLLRRAKGLQARVNGNLTGGDVRDGAISSAQLNRGLILTAATGASGTASRTVLAAAPKNPKRMTLGRQLSLANSRANQANAVLAQVQARLQSGLTGANFRDGSIGAADIAPGTITG